MRHHLRHATALCGAVAATTVVSACVIPTDNPSGPAATTVTDTATETVTTTEHTTAHHTTTATPTHTETVTSWALREPGAPPPAGDWEEMGPHNGERACTDAAAALRDDGRETTGCELRDGRWYFYLATDEEEADDEPAELESGDTGEEG